MKNKILKNTRIFIKIITLNALTFTAFYNAHASGVSFPNPIEATDLRQLVKQILDVVVEFGAIIVVFFVVYSGFLFVKAQGNEGELSKAKATFFWTVVGGMIVLGAHVLSRIIQQTVNQIAG